MVPNGLSFSRDLFSGSMLNFGGVVEFECNTLGVVLEGEIYILYVYIFFVLVTKESTGDVAVPFL